MQSMCSILSNTMAPVLCEMFQMILKSDLKSGPKEDVGGRLALDFPVLATMCTVNIRLLSPSGNKLEQYADTLKCLM